MQIAIDDPSSIRVCGVSATVVSWSSIQDAIKYSIRVDGHLSTHGGFNVEGELGVALRGRGREEINAWLPLFVNERHWQRVKVLIKPVLGYFCTLDPLGWDPRQMDIPFTVLGTLIARLSAHSAADLNDRNLELLFALQRTCIRLVSDCEASHKRVADKVRNFIASPRGRTKDVVSNLVTMIGFVASLPDDTRRDVFDTDEMWRRFMLGFLAEALRRSTHRALGNRAEPVIPQLIDVIVHGYRDNDPLIDPSTLDKLPATQRLKSLRKTRPLSHCEAGDGTTEVVECEAEDLFATEDGDRLFQAGAGEVAVEQAEASRRVLQAFALVAQTRCGEQPGGTAGERRSAKAEADVTSWLRELAGEDSVREVADVDDDDVDLNRVTAAMLDTVARVVNEACNFGFPSIRCIGSTIAFCNAWREIRSRGTDSDLGGQQEVEANGGVIPDVWRDSLRRHVAAVAEAIPQGDALGTARFLLMDGGAEDATDNAGCLTWLRAAAAQSLAHHSNKVARGAMESRRHRDLALGMAEATKVLEQQHHVCVAKRAAAREALRDHAVTESLNRLMASTDDMWTFVGVLLHTHKDRGQGFMNLCDLMKDISCRVPHRVEKLGVLLTGMYRDHPVLASGNIWIPDGTGSCCEA